MASSVDITPTLGHGLVTSQTGPSAGYDAIDDRRFWSVGLVEGVLSADSYAVTQRAAGANMTVDVAAGTGDGALVLGDTVAVQGLYRVAPHVSVINVDIAAANATNPRNDLVVLEVKDDEHDVSGLNGARVRVVTGTPTAGAAQTDAFGVNGTPALPVSAIPLAVINVPATDTAITTSQVDDRRSRSAHVLGPGAPTYQSGAGGKSTIATSESRTNVAYGLLTTPDRVSGVVMPTDGLLLIAYQALWQPSAIATISAAVFLGATQLKVGTLGAAPTAQAATLTNAGTAIGWQQLASGPQGLVSDAANAADSSNVTTGQVVGLAAAGGLLAIQAAAGTYDVSVQFKASAGSVSAKERKLKVWTLGFG